MEQLEIKLPVYDLLKTFKRSRQRIFVNLRASQDSINQYEVSLDDKRIFFIYNTEVQWVILTITSCCKKSP